MVSQTVYSVVIFSHRFLDSDCINFKTFAFLAVYWPFWTSYNTDIKVQQFFKSSTMLNNVFKVNVWTWFFSSPGHLESKLIQLWLGYTFPSKAVRYKSHEIQFSRNWVGHDYLVAVTGSTWFLRGLHSALFEKLTCNVRDRFPFRAT